MAKARIEIHPAAGLGPIGTKNPPIDADKSLYLDSTAGDAAVTSTWAQIKAFLKTYFDTLYAAIGLAHTRLHSITSILDHSSTATPGQILKANANGLPVDATNTDADVADAVAKRHTQGTDTALGVVGIKNPPIDADKALYRDSTAGDALVTSTWTQVKAFLKTYFDTIYGAIGLAHARQHAITSVSDHTSAATPGKMLKADANGLPVDATNTDADVADAVSKKHTQNTDKVIKDADADTQIQVEESADEDKIHMDVKGVEAFLLSDVGIVTLAKQSLAVVYKSAADQSIAYNTWTKVVMDGEVTDIQGEFDSTTNYRFVAKESGVYIVTAYLTFAALGDGKVYVVGIYLDGAKVASWSAITGAAGLNPTVGIAHVLAVAATHYLEIWAYHADIGGARDIWKTVGLTGASFAKIA